MLQVGYLGVSVSSQDVQSQRNWKLLVRNGQALLLEHRKLYHPAGKFCIFLKRLEVGVMSAHITHQNVVSDGKPKSASCSVSLNTGKLGYKTIE